MNDLAKRDGEARRSASARRYLPLAPALCVGVTLSVLVFMMVRGWEQKLMKAEFEDRAGDFHVRGGIHAVITALYQPDEQA